MNDRTARSDEPSILVHRDGIAGHLVLNRPRAINALNYDMVRTLRTQLDAWREDDSVRTVVLTGSGERGLCAGGDIVSLYRDAVEGGTEAEDFWHDEYLLDATIASYPKPFVAVMDGIVLGGGIGVSAHSSVRVVTERSSIGMPETGIGFFPDVGGTWLLAHAPGETGTHLALTAGSVGAGDAIALGMADHYVPSSRIPELLGHLAKVEAISAVARVAEAAPASTLMTQRGWIDTCYAGDDLVSIIGSLRASDEPGAREAADTMATRSPTSLVVTLRALRSASTLPNLNAALAQELRVACRLLRAPDFAEGFRAQVIDKDRNPRWNPPCVEEVRAHSVDTFFRPLDDRELSLATFEPRSPSTVTSGEGATT